MATRAYILVEIEMGKTRSVARTLILDEHIHVADIVTGAFDIIVMMEANNLNELQYLVLSMIHSVPGVLRTTTCVAIQI